MKILLIGIGGVYNYGCEAIVRGTVNKMRKMFPGIEIDYASSNVEDDTRRLNGCQVNIIRRKNKWALWNVSRKALNILHIPNNFQTEDVRLVKHYDAVFSIGGDIYTIFDNGGYAKGLVEFGDYCESHGVPYILWGCSVGPFEQDERIKQIFIKHLSHLSLIVAREYSTIDYLNSLGIKDNVCFSYDPAFSVCENSPMKEIRQVHKVGINLSPLSLAFLKLDVNQCIQNFAELIRFLSVCLGLEVLLIPHVVSKNSKDDDLSFLKKIYDSLENHKNVEIVSSDPGFIGIKERIKGCDIIFAARMHCAINAITCGIPTFFLSYSEKSRGMSKLVYGTEDFCINLKDFTKENIGYYLDKVSTLHSSYRMDDLRLLKEKINSSLHEKSDNNYK